MFVRKPFYQFTQRGAIDPAAAAAAAVTFGAVTNVESTANASTYTFTNAAPAAASDGDWLICIGYRGGGATINSVTAKGVACTSRYEGNNSTNKVAIYSVPLTAAGAGDVVVTLALTADRCGIGVMEIIGAASLVPTDTDIDTSADPNDVTLTVPANGAAVGLVVATSATSYTWTGLTEAFDVDVESGVIFSVATLESVAGGGIAIQADAAGSATNSVMICAAWGP
jgi:hypothetical protein